MQEKIEFWNFRPTEAEKRCMVRLMKERRGVKRTQIMREILWDKLKAFAGKKDLAQ